MWVTESVPIFVTSLSVPFLATVLQVVPDDQVKGITNTTKSKKVHIILPTTHAFSSLLVAEFIISTMMAPVILMMRHGFTITAALSKFNLDRAAATFVIGRSGTKPKNVALAVMFVGAFLSMVSHFILPPMQ